MDDQGSGEVMRVADDLINRCTCPDGPRYKTLGNVVTVQVIEHIGRRILTV